MSFRSTAFLKTLFLTRVYSFWQCGKHSARLWALQQVSLQHTILNPTTRQNRPIKTSNLLYAVSLPVIHLPWIEYAHNSIVCSATGNSPFMASLDYQPPLSHPGRQSCFPLSLSQLKVVLPGVGGAHSIRTSVWRIGTGHLLPPTNLDKRSGSPPVTSPYK